MTKNVCLDFDGVLNTYTGWQGANELFEPREGAREFIEQLHAMGYNVVVHSTREPMHIVDWLLDHGVADAVEYNSTIHAGGSFYGSVSEYERLTGKSARMVVGVMRHKPPAVAYVDDRAIRFDGDFDAVLEALSTFKAHWERATEAREAHLAPAAEAPMHG